MSVLMSEFYTPTEKSRASEKAKEKGEGRKLLHELEKTGQYVFHGSSVSDLGELEIRQPFDWTEGERKEHGVPSVVATPYADIAIFRSLVYRDYTGFGSDNQGRLYFDASQKALDAARKSVGYVYVLERTDFSPMHGDEFEMDWRATISQQPSKIVRVMFDDLPEEIRLIESRPPGQVDR